jgi:hypothetical protein
MRTAISILLIVLAVATPVWADERSLHWYDLSTFVADHSIALTLPDGARIEGRAIAFEPAQLVLDVHKTTDPSAHPRGRQSIPRAQAQIFVVNRPTIRWRIIGTSIGGIAGVPVGVVAALEKDGLFSNKGNGNGIVVAIIAGLASAGFLLGWAADRRKTTVTVLSEPSPE